MKPPIRVFYHERYDAIRIFYMDYFVCLEEGECEVISYAHYERESVIRNHISNWTEIYVPDVT